MHGAAIWARMLPVVAAVAVLATSCSGGSGHPASTGTSTTKPKSHRTATTRPAGSSEPPPGATSTTTPVAKLAPFSPRVLLLAVPPTIQHTCTTDVTGAIQSWIDSVPDNVVLSFAPGGCYRVDGTIELLRRRHVVINGNGATFKVVTIGDRTRQTLVLTGGSVLTVRDLTVRGPNPTAGATGAAYHRSLEAQHAFQVSGATNVVLDHVQAYDVYGDFVYIGPNGDRPSRNVTVTNSTFEGSGRQGISVTDAEQVTIRANTIGGVARSLFDIEPNVASQEARSIHIIDNTTGAATNFWLADKGAAGSVGDIEVSGNHMTAATGGLIFVYIRNGPYRGPFVIRSNQFIAGTKVHDEGSSGALFFTHARNVSITGNQVLLPPGSGVPAVELRDAQQVRVHANTFTNAGQPVLSTQGSSYAMQ